MITNRDEAVTRVIVDRDFRLMRRVAWERAASMQTRANAINWALVAAGVLIVGVAVFEAVSW